MVKKLNKTNLVKRKSDTRELFKYGHTIESAMEKLMDEVREEELTIVGKVKKVPKNGYGRLAHVIARVK